MVCLIFWLIYIDGLLIEFSFQITRQPLFVGWPDCHKICWRMLLDNGHEFPSPPCLPSQHPKFHSMLFRWSPYLFPANSTSYNWWLTCDRDEALGRFVDPMPMSRPLWLLSDEKALGHFGTPVRCYEVYGTFRRGSHVCHLVISVN